MPYKANDHHLTVPNMPAHNPTNTALSKGIARRPPIHAACSLHGQFNIPGDQQACKVLRKHRVAELEALPFRALPGTQER